jgi:hypothetical protein
MLSASGSIILPLTAIYGIEISTFLSIGVVNTSFTDIPVIGTSILISSLLLLIILIISSVNVFSKFDSIKSNNNSLISPLISLLLIVGLLVIFVQSIVISLLLKYPDNVFFNNSLIFPLIISVPNCR